jgi:hypothetical protein
MRVVLIWLARIQLLQATACLGLTGIGRLTGAGRVPAISSVIVVVIVSTADEREARSPYAGNSAGLQEASPG